MSRSTCIAVTTVTILACTPSPRATDYIAAPWSPSWRVGFWQVGPLRYGMSVREVSAAIGETLHVSPDTTECWTFVHPREAPPGLLIMIANDTLERVDVNAPGIPTTSGVQVGWTVGQLRRLYNDSLDMQTSLGGDTEFTISSNEPERRRLMVFQMSGGVVGRYRAGRRMAAQFEECNLH